MIPLLKFYFINTKEKLEYEEKKFVHNEKQQQIKQIKISNATQIKLNRYRKKQTRYVTKLDKMIIFLRICLVKISFLIFIDLGSKF